MAFIFTVKARQCNCSIYIVAGSRSEGDRREGRKVCAGRGARFVGTIGAVAEIVVQAGDGKVYRGGRYACEGFRVFVVFGNYSVGQQSSHATGTVLGRGVEHSGPTPRGRGASVAAIVRAAATESIKIYGLLILRIVKTGLRLCAVKESFTKGVSLGIERPVWD